MKERYNFVADLYADCRFFFSLLLPNLMKKIPKNIGKKIHLL